MSIKKRVADLVLRPVNRLGGVYYPRQKPRLDGLRSTDRYAVVVFDALRYDYAAKILPQYLEGEVDVVWSEAHDTFQYGERCWGDQVYDTTYVSGAVPINTDQDFEKEWFNQLYGDFRPENNLPNLVDAWEDAWETQLGTVCPDELTQIALGYTDRDELAVHYFQPHAPYIGRRSFLGHTGTGDGEPLTGEPVDGPIWERVKSGAISKHELQVAYQSNIHRAVQAALPLIRELCSQDRRVVVMADHGELLADYDQSMVSHPRMSFPQIRRVPWMEVDGVRDLPAGVERRDESVTEKLEALGYV